ncbi:MAG: hypothetical protein ACR2PF_18325, partial [Rhizobiaceae bacterium]
MTRRLEQIEASVARYLHQLDSADRQEPSLARTTKIDHLQDKVAKLKQEMARLRALEVEMLASQPANGVALKGKRRASSLPISCRVQEAYGSAEEDWCGWRDLN